MHSQAGAWERDKLELGNEIISLLYKLYLGVFIAEDWNKQ